MTAFSFFSAFRTKREPVASLPAGEIVYAIGDIHGRADLLARLLDQIAVDEASRGATATQIIFLGDLVDRGPESCQVLDLVIALESQRRVRVLRGNHDEVFRRAARGDERSTRALHKMGGRATLLSYGIGEAEYDAAHYDELTVHLRELVPAPHLDLLDRMEDIIVLGDYVFVHAGVRPGVPLDEQTAEDLYWIRNDFLHHRGDFGGVVIHGHSIVSDVDVRPNRIGIDTGAYESHKLTAIGLEGDQRWFLST
jgi:serine/threonine protein phosphatase 1